MLWKGDSETGEPEKVDTEEIVEAEPSAAESSDDAEPPAAAETDEEKVGESRYARKSRHLPRIEEDGEATSTGTGLRDAIIGSHHKRGGGSA